MGTKIQFIPSFFPHQPHARYRLRSFEFLQKAFEYEREEAVVNEGVHGAVSAFFFQQSGSNNYITVFY